MIAALAPAPIKDLRTNIKIDPEATEAKKEQSQRFQRVQGEVGTVPVRTENLDHPVAEFNGDAKNILRAASPTGSDSDATQVLQKAALKLHHEEKSPVTTFFLGFLVLGLGFGVVFGVKTWVERQMPEIPKPKQVTW